MTGFSAITDGFVNRLIAILQLDTPEERHDALIRWGWTYNDRIYRYEAKDSGGKVWASLDVLLVRCKSVRTDNR